MVVPSWLTHSAGYVPPILQTFSVDWAVPPKQPLPHAPPPPLWVHKFGLSYVLFRLFAKSGVDDEFRWVYPLLTVEGTGAEAFSEELKRGVAARYASGELPVEEIRTEYRTDPTIPAMVGGTARQRMQDLVRSRGSDRLATEGVLETTRRTIGNVEAVLRVQRVREFLRDYQAEVATSQESDAEQLVSPLPQLTGQGIQLEAHRVS